MSEIINWHDTSILWAHHWLWLMIAFIIGVVIGYRFNSWKIS